MQNRLFLGQLIIPKEVLENVLRFFSGIPNSKSWETHLKLSHVTSLLAVSGELGTLLDSRFKTRCLSETKNCYLENNHCGWKLRTDPHLWTNKIALARRYITAGGGESLETLVIGLDMYDEERDGWEDETDTDEVLSCFLYDCPNLKSSSITNMVGNGWNGSEMRGGYPLYVPANMAGLRELTLEFYDGKEGGNDFWEKVGLNLETLTVHGVTYFDKVVGDIKRHCRNLKRKSIHPSEHEGIDEGEASLAKLLVSYGPQLDYALIFNMGDVEIRRVADACPNAGFPSRDHAANISVSILNLDALTIFGSEDYDHGARINAWNNFMNLRELLMSESSAKDQQKVLELVFSDYDPSKYVKKAMDTCGKGTKRVEKLIYEGPPIYRDGVYMFCEANKASLSSVTLEGKKLGELLDLLLELSALGELYLDGEIPHSVYKTLQMRGVY